MPRPVRTRDDELHDRTPERGRLAVAITKHNEARERLEALQAAQEKATREKRDARGDIIDAEKRLCDAQRAGPRSYVDRLLGGDTDVVDEVEAAHRELDDARRRERRAEEAAELLGREIVRADGWLASMRGDRQKAIGEVCLWSPSVEDAVTAYFAAFKTASTLFAVLDKLRLLDALPPAGKSFEAYVDFRSRHDYPVDEKVIAEWDAALTALREDPDAQLPEITHRAPRVA